MVCGDRGDLDAKQCGFYRMLHAQYLTQYCMRTNVEPLLGSLKYMFVSPGFTARLAQIQPLCGWPVLL